MSGLTHPLPIEWLKRRISEHAQTDKGLVRMAFYADVAWVCQVFGASVVGGSRTDKRNRAHGGKDDSKHLERGGWGCAADLWFDLAHQREAAIEALEQLGWHTYVGPHYASQRLHVQAFAYGVRPEPPHETVSVASGEKGGRDAA